MHYKEYKAILSAGNGMNIYRGCSHGCIYCDSRSTCYQMDHDFEDIEVKINAPDLLEKALIKKRHRCMIGTGSMCDPYMHVEKELKLTQRCLEIIEKHGFGVSILTKSNLILRDLNLLKRIHQKAKVVVQVTLTTYDEDLCKILEPHVAATKERFEVLKKCRDELIPTVVWFTPILPFINDTEANIKGIIEYCVEAKVWGIIYFGAGVTLREGDREYYYQKLNEFFPGLKEKYQIKYQERYIVPSPEDDKLSELFHKLCKTYGIESDSKKVFAYLNQFPNKPSYEQMSSF
jgi:DNA repair photolyase